MEMLSTSHPKFDVRWSVVLNLQEIMSKALPGSRLFRIADKAIEFALSPRRIPDRPDYFIRNVWRNAAHSLARGDKRRTEIPLDSVLPESPNQKSNRDNILIIQAENYTPEDLAAGQDLRDQIGELSEQVAPGLGKACVNGMIASDTIAETADDLKVSPKTVKRVRDKIRTVASELIREAA